MGNLRVGVTGGTGFVGRYLLQCLKKRNYSVNALSRKEKKHLSPEFKWYQGDINDLNSLFNFLENCDVVCNCAGEITNPQNYQKTNFNGVKTLYEASKQAGVDLFIQLSSAGIYKTPSEGFIYEESQLHAYDGYEKSKLDADEWLFSQKEIRTIILRPTTIYGPDMPNQSLKALLNSVLNGKFFFIGSKKAMSSYMSVENLVDAILQVIEKKEDLSIDELCQAYNLSHDISFEEFIDLSSKSLLVKTPKLRIPLVLVLLLLKLNKMSLNLKLPLTENRARALARLSSFSSNKFEDSFLWKPKLPHSVTINNCVKEWF